jgi:hypothetical protein
MTAVEEILAGKPPEPDRDNYGRYRILDPKTGKVISWTRATTWASTVADTFGLTNWKVRMTALGLAQRKDLLLAVAAIEDPDGKDSKKKLDKLAEAAMEHAGSSVRATIGTALHSITEAHDAGREPAVIPEPYDADLAAYVLAICDAELRIDPSHIERIVCVPELGVAGTFDRLITLPDGRTVVADLKTGRDLSYSWTEIAIQLAIYAHASSIYDVLTGKHQPMPVVDQSEALVMHLPVGEARCDLYMVDIAAGWEMASVCGTVRDWRKRKDLAKRYDATTDRTAWITDRIQTLNPHPQAKLYAARNWPAGCPPKPPWTNQQVDQIAAVLTEAEAIARAPFHDGDPDTPKREGWVA